MKNRMVIWTTVVFLSLNLVSCNFPLAQSSPSNADVGTLVAVQVAQTELAATMNVTPVVSSPTAQPLPLEPSATPTVTLTPMPTFTPTLEGVWLLVNENTNCRSGPGNYYELVSTVKKGTQVQAVARNPNNDYYYVQNPEGAGYCWLWDQYSSMTGNITTLPVFTPQPTPTLTVTPSPAPGVSVSFVSLTSCGGQYALRLKIKNTGGIIWQSVRIDIKDTFNNLTFTHTSDQFKGYTGCPSDVVQQDLTPGEDGIVSNVNPGQFNYDPSGHHLKVSVTVYSQDGLAGDSYSTSLNVTP